MRAFVTGASGFVGHWLVAHLEACGDDVAVLAPGTDLSDPQLSLDQLVEHAPEVVYHLAARTHVGHSWEQPAETYQVNVLGTLAVLEAARRVDPMPRVILVSSSEVYGRADRQPLNEDAPLRPVTPYASSKVAAEFLGVQAYLGRGLPVVRVRPFNHVGPGQSADFVVSALARRVVLAERESATEIVVGNLAAVRDFTDVRDVVRAYRLLVTAGEPGEVYNVCSGQGVEIADLLARLVELSGHELRTKQDPALLRPVEVPALVGDGRRLFQATKWQPELFLDQTLADVLEDWRTRLKAAAGSS